MVQILIKKKLEDIDFIPLLLSINNKIMKFKKVYLII